MDTSRFKSSISLISEFLVFHYFIIIEILTAGKAWVRHWKRSFVSGFQCPSRLLPSRHKRLTPCGGREGNEQPARTQADPGLVLSPSEWSLVGV